MVEVLVAILGVTICMGAGFVVYLARLFERHNTQLRESETKHLQERTSMEERYMNTIRELSRLVKAKDATEAVQVQHKEHLNKLEKEAMTAWYKEKLVPKEDTSSIPKTLKTPDGHELQLMEIT